MTPLQKNIISRLLDGHNVVGTPAYGFRLRDSKQAVVLRFGYRTFYGIRKLLRKQKGCFVIDKNKVRQLDGRCFAKRLYKKLRSSSCEPCRFEIPKRTVTAKPSRKRHVAASDEPILQMQIF